MKYHKTSMVKPLESKTYWAKQEAGDDAAYYSVQKDQWYSAYDRTYLIPEPTEWAEADFLADLDEIMDKCSSDSKETT